MKFAKLLQRAVTATHRISPDLWVDYKGLKKLLLAFSTPGAAPPAAAPTGVDAMAACPHSCAFFSQVMWELNKVSTYYCEAEAALVVQYNACLEKLKLYLTLGAQPAAGASGGASGGGAGATAAAGPEDSSQLLGSLLSTCLYLTSELIQLENFAVLCYAGFGKILKKHDKLTGACV